MKCFSSGNVAQSKLLDSAGSRGSFVSWQQCLAFSASLTAAASLHLSFPAQFYRPSRLHSTPTLTPFQPHADLHHSVFPKLAMLRVWKDGQRVQSTWQHRFSPHGGPSFPYSQLQVWWHYCCLHNSITKRELQFYAGIRCRDSCPCWIYGLLNLFLFSCSPVTSLWCCMPPFFQ